MHPTGDFSKCTPREIQILELLCQGCENQEIAAELTKRGTPIATRTIKAHLNRLYIKQDIDCKSFKRVKLAVLYHRWTVAQTLATNQKK